MDVRVPRLERVEVHEGRSLESREVPVHRVRRAAETIDGRRANPQSFGNCRETERNFDGERAGRADRSVDLKSRGVDRGDQERRGLNLSGRPTLQEDDETVKRRGVVAIDRVPWVDVEARVDPAEQVANKQVQNGIGRHRSAGTIREADLAAHARGVGDPVTHFVPFEYVVSALEVDAEAVIVAGGVESARAVVVAVALLDPVPLIVAADERGAGAGVVAEAVGTALVIGAVALLVRIDHTVATGVHEARF